MTLDGENVGVSQGNAYRLGEPVVVNGAVTKVIGKAYAASLGFGQIEKGLADKVVRFN